MSSVQAVAGYPAALEPLPPDLPPNPAGPYGLTKACGETLARMMVDMAGASVVVLRVGAVAGAPADEDIERVRTSTADLAAAVTAAVAWRGTGCVVLNVVSHSARLLRSDPTTALGG
ncbi:hypothetical protein GCM10029978_004650 [Actinoallomurus acanthiterrae]